MKRCIVFMLILTLVSFGAGSVIAKEIKNGEPVNKSKANSVIKLDEKGRFADQKDGTIFDSHTRLEWVKDGISVSQIFDKVFGKVKKGETRTITGEIFMQYVKQLSIGKHSDWRIPTEKEMETLLSGDRFPLGGSMDWFLYFFNQEEGLLASTALRSSSNTEPANKGLWPVRGPLPSSSK